HAIRAFEANAVNYLMKPVDEDKLADTLDRVRTRLAEKRSAEEAKKLQDVLAEIAPEAIENLPTEEENSGRYERMINIKDQGKIFRVDVDTIEHIEAAGDYMCIYTGENSLILRETMKDLERRLDLRVFQRVHRSTIVNLDQVRQVQQGSPDPTESQRRVFPGDGFGRGVKSQPVVPRSGGALRPLRPPQPSERLPDIALRD